MTWVNIYDEIYKDTDRVWFIEGAQSGVIKVGYKSREEAEKDLIDIKRFDEENNISDSYYIDYEYI